MYDMSGRAASQPSPERPHLIHGILPVIGAVTCTLMVVGFISASALSTLLTDGAAALLIILAGGCLGAPIARLTAPAGIPVRWRILLSFGLGLGALSLLVLGSGCLGVMNPTFWRVALAGCVAAGLSQWRWVLDRDSTLEPIGRPGIVVWLLPWLIPFAAFSLAIATLPPGLAWPGEGRGYDALEYHLGAPRDYLDAGRISYLPNNIYSNFPFNMEMLYLLAMIIRGDAIHGALSAQIIHAMFAFLSVTAIWLAAREVSPSAGIVAAFTAATTPFLFYLSALAYVEHGLLFYSALAMACAVRAIASRGSNRTWVMLSGVFAGLGCGCKYTAIGATVAPLLLVILVDRFRRKLDRLKAPAIFLASAALPLAPWLVKNTIATHNPVFPLGYSVLGARDGVWTDSLAEQWHRGHLPAVKDRTMEGRLERLGTQILWSPYFGPVVILGLLGAMTALIRRPTRRDGAVESPAEPGGLAPLTWVCVSTLVCGVVFWISLTHLVDRFAIVLIAPCAILVGVGCQRMRHPAVRRVAIALPLMAAILNARTISLLLTTENPVSEAHASQGELERLNYLSLGDELFGATSLMTSESGFLPHVARVNEITRRGGRVLVVGDARRLYYDKGADYCVVFNRNPFAEAAASHSPAALLDRLRSSGYTHIYVDWTECRRLRGTYGFWEAITPELFQRLLNAGLREVENFPPDQRQSPMGTLFEIPMAPGGATDPIAEERGS